jgi:hypothetical protein
MMATMTPQTTDGSQPDGGKKSLIIPASVDTAKMCNTEARPISTKSEGPVSPKMRTSKDSAPETNEIVAPKNLGGKVMGSSEVIS